MLHLAGNLNVILVIRSKIIRHADLRTVLVSFAVRNLGAMTNHRDIPGQYGRRINAVKSYVLKNLEEELPLAKLASIANYSPFHFQRLFTEYTGESPKHFIIRMRLENSARCLIVDRHKSIGEVALDCGFDNPANFSRAFKNYFGISAKELRSLSPKELLSFRRTVGSRKSPELGTFFDSEYDAQYWKNNMNVFTVHLNSIRALTLDAPMSDMNKIQEAYKRIVQLADFHDLLNSDTRFVGIISPLSGLYQAGVTLQSHEEPPANTGISEIQCGKYATYEMKGDTLQTIHSFHAFYELWLAKSNYRIRHHYNLEILSQNPLTKPYHEIQKEIYIPIEPATD